MTSDSPRRPFLRYRRAVVDENGTRHTDSMAAAEARGMSTAGAYRRARFNQRGWYFEDSPPQQPVDPPAPDRGE